MENIKDEQVTTIYQLSNMVKTFCEEWDWDQFHNPKDLAIGISTEANELLDIFRFKSEEDIKQICSNESDCFRRLIDR